MNHFVSNSMSGRVPLSLFAVVIVTMQFLAKASVPPRADTRASAHWRGSRDDRPSFLSGRGPRSVVRSREWLWHSRVVPFYLDRSLTPSVTLALKKAMAEIEDKSCVQFKPRTSEKDFIHVTSLDGCWSDVGRVGGKQLLSAGVRCGHTGIMAHELLHALGFWHEHCRLDRDRHVQVMWENIDNEMEYNFMKHDWMYNDLQDLPYDYNSVMHYRNDSFSKNRKPTIVPLAAMQGELGQRNGLSDLDVQKLNKLYHCNVSSGWTPWGNWSPCSVECSRYRERFCVSRGCRGESQQYEVCPGNCHPAKYFGCWVYDASNPAIPSLEGTTDLLSASHRLRLDPVRECADAARALGYQLFALTDDSVCLSGPEAHVTYRRDGPSEKCSFTNRGTATSLFAYTLQYDVPVDGQWGVWSAWSRCSRQCGPGVRTRTRHCDNPEPEAKGLPCPGNSTQTKDCQIKSCDVPGNIG